MEIKINIEKKYMWLLLLAISAVGLAVAYNYPGPPSTMGHTIGEIEGVPINCIEGQSYSSCQALSGAPTGTWTDRRQIAAFSSMAFDTERLGGAAATQYCRADGTNCPAGVRSTTVHKIPVNYYCEGTAFLCQGTVAYGSDPIGIRLSWSNPGGSGFWRYLNSNNVWTQCNGWVLCSSPDPALP